MCAFLNQVELLSGGVNMPVTPLNVYEYVRKYAEHRMLVVSEQPLHVCKIIKIPVCILICVCKTLNVYTIFFQIGNEEGFTGCTP